MTPATGNPCTSPTPRKSLGFGSGHRTVLTGILLTGISLTGIVLTGIVLR